MQFYLTLFVQSHETTECTYQHFKGNCVLVHSHTFQYKETFYGQLVYENMFGRKRNIKHNWYQWNSAHDFAALNLHTIGQIR